MDPRPSVIDKRLAQVRRILAVTGGKGGIGKSSVASLLALVLSRQGLRTGLLDLDLTSPSDHVILGFDGAPPRETFGLEPALCDGIRFMSVACFLGPAGAPLRGSEVSDALLELLAVTRWEDLDVLVLDMPPGLGDATLDLARLIRRAEYLVVAGSSRVVLETVRKTLRLLGELRMPVLGVLENMQRGESDAVRELALEHAVPFLGALPFDDGLEAATGESPALLRTEFARELTRVAAALLARPA